MTGRLNAAKALYERIPSHVIINPDGDDDDEEDMGVAHDRLAVANFIEYEFLVQGIDALDSWKTAVGKNPGYVFSHNDLCVNNHSTQSQLLFLASFPNFNYTSRFKSREIGKCQKLIKHMHTNATIGNTSF